MRMPWIKVGAAGAAGAAGAVAFRKRSRATRSVASAACCRRRSAWTFRRRWRCVFEGLQQFVRFGFLSRLQWMQVWYVHSGLLVDEQELYGHNGGD